MGEQIKQKKNNNKKQKRAVMRTLILTLLVAAIGYTIYNSATAEDVSMLEVGDKAPDFALVDLEGNNHKLSDYEDGLHRHPPE